MSNSLVAALTHLQAGNPAMARSLLMTAARQEPDSAESIHYLGLAEYQLGNTERGLALLRQSVEMAPEQVPFLDNLSQALQQQGAVPEAAQCVHRALALNPRLPQLWLRLGELFMQIRRYAKADQCFESALGLQPDSAQAVAGITASLRAQLRNLDALLFLKRYLPLVTSHLDLLLDYCDLLILSGEYQPAINYLEHELADGNTDNGIYALLGLAYGSLGNFPEADKYLFKSIEGDQPCTSSLVRLAATRKFAAQDPLIPRMQAILSASGEPMDTVYAHFALGKAHNDLKEFDLAFGHYQEGNRLVHGLRPYSSAQHNRYINETIRCFDQSRVNVAPPLLGSPGSVTPIFVLGMPRSGTTLVEQMIATHPAVTAGGELPFMTHELLHAIGAGNMRNPQAMAELARDELARVRDGYLRHLAELADGRQFVTDKLPGNFMRIGLLHMLFPQAPILHCSRDPMDTCLSCYFTLFGQGQEYTYDLPMLADYYQAYRRIMQHWNRVLGLGRILKVCYEELVQDPEPRMREIFGYCGLSWNAGFLEFHEAARPIRTASVYQVRQPLYRTSVGRWHNYAHHLAALQAALYA